MPGLADPKAYRCLTRIGAHGLPLERCLTNAEQFAKVIDAPPKP